MAITAGQMILAGDIEFAIRAYERGGRGFQGWQSAFAQLRERHPDAHGRSLNAVIERAFDVVAAGNRYRHGGFAFSPDPTQIPDVRRLERPFVPTLDPITGLPTGARYHHVGLIEIRDPSRGGALFQTFSHRMTDSNILTRAEIEDLLWRKATEFVNRFVRSDPTRFTPMPMDISIRIEGVYRGF